MKIVPIKVNKRTFYLFDENPIGRNIEFLENIQPLYFYDIAKDLLTKFKDLNNRNELRNYIAVQIRTIYGQAVETFIAFIFALLQSPFSMVAWLQKYKVNDLKELVKLINNKQSIKYYKIQMLKPGWEGLSETINMFKANSEEEKQYIHKAFAEFWQSIGKEFLDQKLYKEYCNIKHGFRIEHGGFKIILSKTMDLNDNDIIVKGESDFGSKIYLDEEVKNKPIGINAFSLRKSHFNWDIDYLYNRIELLSYSINNIISFALGMLNNDFTKEEFLIPDSLSLFEKATHPKSGIHTFDLDISYDCNNFKNLKFQDIDDYYKTKIISIPKELL